MEPQVIPEHPVPETLQTTMPLPGPLAANCTCAPVRTRGELGLTISCEVAATIVAVALEDLAGSATETAEIVTLGEAGTLVGAVYKPLTETVPQADPEHPVPATAHLTDAFVVPATLAENCCCAPALICTVDGETKIDIDVANAMSTVAETDFAGVATVVAVTIVCAGLGMMAGAV
jgi:hypothetical protein